MNTFHRTIMTLCLIAVTVLAICCSKQEALDKVVERVVTRQSTPDIDGFVLNKLRDNRIVMLGDNGHGQAEYMRTVISVLNTWIDEMTSAEQATNLPRSIVLVWECDSITSRNQLRYGRTGDIQDLLVIQGFSIPTFTTAKLEFYTRVVDALDRVDEYNHNQSDSSKWLHLSVRGLEKVIDLHNWSFKQRTRFFLDVRDSALADAVTECAEKNPGLHLLIFYGSAHLNKIETTKYSDTLKQQGYYLAHYLADRFDGNGSMYTIGQLYGDDWKQFEPIFDMQVTPFAIDHADFKPYVKTAPGLTYYDGSILLHGTRELPIPISLIPSKRVVDFLIDSLPTILDVDNDYSRISWGPIEDYLEMVFDAPYTRFDVFDAEMPRELIEQWKSRRKSAPLDFPHDVYTLDYWNRRIVRFEGMPPHSSPTDARFYDRQINRSLLTEPAIAQVDGRWPSTKERAAQHRKFIEDHKDWLITSYLVNLLWVGTDKEREEAMNLLQKITGKSFASNEEWMEWWRAGDSQ